MTALTIMLHVLHKTGTHTYITFLVYYIHTHTHKMNSSSVAHTHEHTHAHTRTTTQHNTTQHNTHTHTPQKKSNYFYFVLCVCECVCVCARARARVRRSLMQKEGSRSVKKAQAWIITRVDSSLWPSAHTAAFMQPTHGLVSNSLSRNKPRRNFDTGAGIIGLSWSDWHSPF